MANKPEIRWDPIFGGIAIGLIMVLTFYISGRGFGTSGGMTRIVAWMQDLVAPSLTANSVYFAKYFEHGHPLYSYLVFMVGGVMLGGLLAALTGRGFKFEITRGDNASPLMRLIGALAGGILIGFAARLARGCTSGQALVGGAQLSVGSWIFMLCIFAGGFAAAYFVRRQWL
jgi:uncharacterized membrane protein YedE/YeeE